MPLIKKIGDSWTYCNAYGNPTDQYGDLIYHPMFFDDQPKGYAIYEDGQCQLSHYIRMFGEKTIYDYYWCNTHNRKSLPSGC